MAYFVLSGRGVFHGSTDSHIDGDVRVASEQSHPWDAIYKNAEQKVGVLQVAPGHFEISRQRQSRAFSLVHILQMDEKVCDWHTGLSIRSYPPDELEQHHIFPRTHLQVKGVETPKINAVANIALISRDTNRRISDTPPESYLAEIDDQDGGTTLDAHCIPRDRNLWKMEKYEEFLIKRRKLMAVALNALLEKLMVGRFV